MTKKIVKNVKNVALSEEDLQDLAHEGTKEAIKKIEAYMASETDDNKKFYAEMALEECELFYYEPNNEKEEEDFLLSGLIRSKQKHLDELYLEVDEIEDSLKRFELEKKVYDKVIKSSVAKGKEWEFHNMDDYVLNEKAELEDLHDDITYLETWIKEAKKMITIPRYKDGIPERLLSHYDFGFDDFGDDCCDDDCCSDGCCDDDCCDDDCYDSDECPCCGSRDAERMDEVPF